MPFRVRQITPSLFGCPKGIKLEAPLPIYMHLGFLEVLAKSYFIFQRSNPSFIIIFQLIHIK